MSYPKTAADIELDFHNKRMNRFFKAPAIYEIKNRIQRLSANMKIQNKELLELREKAAELHRLAIAADSNADDFQSRYNSMQTEREIEVAELTKLYIEEAQDTAKEFKDSIKKIISDTNILSVKEEVVNAVLKDLGTLKNDHYYDEKN